MSDMSADRGDVARSETASLISSDKVAGASVYDAAGEKVGSIHSIMMGKADGRAAYAVLSLGGAITTGPNYYPVPWSALKYDTDLGGYGIAKTKSELEAAPNYEGSADWHERNHSWTGEVDAFYQAGAPPV